MKKKYHSFDMSSFMWRGLLAGRDSEDGFKVMHNEKEVLINSAGYGYENVLSLMLGVLKKYNVQPINTIMVFEGMNSKSKRRIINKDYKAGSDKPKEAYEQFHIMKEMLQKTWKDVGAQTMWQDFAEGDDTLAWLAVNMEVDMLIHTYDNDIAALNGVNAHGAKIEVWIDGLVGSNKYGPFDFDLITTYKALVGDSSDNIKGCVGFGPGAFDKLLVQYGEEGLRELHNMLATADTSPLFALSEDPNNKLLKKIWDQHAAVQNSFDLAKLRPAWVNTMKHPIIWEPGMVRQLQAGDDIRMKQWYGRTRLVTGAVFDEAIAWARDLIAASEEVTLDIETSTPDESDEWLARQGKEDGVDVFGSYLVGLGLTFGKNNQYSLYFSVRHADTDNCSSERLRQFIASLGKPTVIHNTSFELSVLYNEWGQMQLENGCHGFLPNVLDSMLEASYTDENNSRGLKDRSISTLHYEQQTFLETTRLSGYAKDLFPGGVILVEGEPTYKTQMIGTGKFEPLFDDISGEVIGQGAEIMKDAFVLENGEKIVVAPPIQTRKYKMHELPATHVVGYGVDDTICTAALHNYFRLFMQLEHTWNVYLQCEIDSAYQHAKNFIDGMDISLEKMRELEAEDDITYDNSWKVLRTYLIKHGWAGTQPPSYTCDIEPAQVKEAFEIVTGEVLDTKMRNIDKMAKFAEGKGEIIFASHLMDMVFDTGVPLDVATKKFNDYVCSFFKGEPQFNDGSSKQMQHLLYDVMALPIRVRNKPTKLMRENGIYEGSPKTDLLAIAYALQECTAEQKEVLEALKLMGMVGTRRSLYYSKYPNFPHWKDGKIHGSHNQCSTVTRRASESAPNKQQLPKHSKIEGQEAKFREIVVPHHPDAVIVSMDFDSQEMVLIAEQSQDPNMLSCFVGDVRRSPHTITGLGIAQADHGVTWTYEHMAEAVEHKSHPDYKLAKECRTLGKKVNFTAEYGAMAPKVAATMIITEEKAQLFLDAREAMYPVAGQWKKDIIDDVKQFGLAYTMMGAIRHLGPALQSGDRWIASKAERQAVNYYVQGPAAEQTKLAEGRMWKMGLFFDYDAVCIGPVHDEVLASVMIVDLPEFLPKMHACMVAKYADMAITPVSTISFGKDLYRQVEIGAYPTKEAIEAGLVEMWKGIEERKEKKRLALAA